MPFDTHTQAMMPEIKNETPTKTQNIQTALNLVIVASFVSFTDAKDALISILTPLATH
jgi:hypothetical protein